MLAVQLALGVGLSLYMVHLGRSSLESSAVTTEEVVEVVEVVEEVVSDEDDTIDIDEQDGPVANMSNGTVVSGDSPPGRAPPLHFHGRPLSHHTLPLSRGQLT